MLQHGQDVRQRHLPAVMVELQVNLRLGGLDRPVKVEAEALGVKHLLDPLDVEDGRFGSETIAVADIEGGGIAAVQAQALFLAMGIDQGILQPVGPRAARLDQPLLDRAHVIVRDGAGLRFDDELNPRQHAFGQLGDRRPSRCRRTPSPGSPECAGADRCRNGRAGYRRGRL